MTSARPRGASLLVPVGGPSLWWSLLARYGLLISLSFFTWAVPLPKVAGWFNQIENPVRNLTFKLLSPVDPEFGQLFFRWVVPAIIAALWLLLDRKRKHEAAIMETARVMARFGLAMTMASYGFEKIFGAQGSSAYASDRLLRPFGELGGQTTLMAWLGHSTIYEEFTGWVEAGGAFLLAFRRTATLGALIQLAAMVNVYVANTGHWDVLLSFTPLQFINMPLFLLAPEIARMVAAFSGKGTGAVAHTYLTPPRWWTYGGYAAKVVMVPWLFLGNSHLFHAIYEDLAAQSPFHAAYTVERFVKNGKEEPLAHEYPTRWREVAISSFAGNLTVQTVDRTEFSLDPTWKTPSKDAPPPPKDATLQYIAQLEKVKQPEGVWEYGHYSTERAIMGRGDSRDAPGSLRYHRRTRDDVTLTGKVDGDSLEITLRRIALDTLPFYRHRWYATKLRADIARWIRKRGFIYPY